MRKVTKSKVVCESCGQVKKHEEYDEFCDYCKQKIPYNIYQRSIDLTVFFESDSDLDHTKQSIFCSWCCCKQFLDRFPYDKATVDFISLPYITKYEGSFSGDLETFLRTFKEPKIE